MNNEFQFWIGITLFFVGLGLQHYIKTALHAKISFFVAAFFLFLAARGCYHEKYPNPNLAVAETKDTLSIYEPQKEIELPDASKSKTVKNKSTKPSITKKDSIPTIYAPNNMGGISINQQGGITAGKIENYNVITNPSRKIDPYALAEEIKEFVGDTIIVEHFVDPETEQLVELLKTAFIKAQCIYKEGESMLIVAPMTNWTGIRFFGLPEWQNSRDRRFLLAEKIYYHLLSHNIKANFYKFEKKDSLSPPRTIKIRVGVKPFDN